MNSVEVRQESGSAFSGFFCAMLATSKRNKSRNTQFYSQNKINMAWYTPGTKLLGREILFPHIAITFQNVHF